MLNDIKIFSNKHEKRRKKWQIQSELQETTIQEQKIIPVLFSPITSDDLNNTPILGTHMCYGDKKEGLMAIHDEFFKHLVRVCNRTETVGFIFEI